MSSVPTGTSPATTNGSGTYLLFAAITDEQASSVQASLPHSLPLDWNGPLPPQAALEAFPAVIWASSAMAATAAKVAQDLLRAGCKRVSVVQDAPDLVDHPFAADLIAKAKPVGTSEARVPRGTSKPKMPKEQAGAALAPGTNVPAYVLWEQLNLGRNDRGPFATEANALRIISSHKAYAGRIWLDEFSQQLMIDDDASKSRQFSRTDAIECQVWMQEYLALPKMPLTAVERAVLLCGAKNARHPIKDYIDALQWDGVERLPALMSAAFGARQTEYSAAVGRCWVTAMVARVYDPGCKFDYAVVFEGPQGLRKSSALSIMGGRWFLESSINPSRYQKDFLLSLQGKWIVEIPEFDRAGDVTAMLSIRNDTYRVPYGATSMDYPRQCVFTGTTNFDTYSDDPSGARRLWPIICGQIDLDYLTINRDQLFAEAMHRYQAGEAWWDVPEAEAKAAQASRRTVDEWEGEILHYLTHEPTKWEDRNITWSQRDKPLTQVTPSEILAQALNLIPEKWTQPNQNRIARCLKALGFKRTTARTAESATPVRIWRLNREG